MGLDRSQVSLLNTLRCRPQPYHEASKEEIQRCLPWLEAQLQILQPDIICTLGSVPLQALSGNWEAGGNRLSRNHVQLEQYSRHADLRSQLSSTESGRKITRLERPPTNHEAARLTATGQSLTN